MSHNNMAMEATFEITDVTRKTAPRKLVAFSDISNNGFSY